MKEVFISEKKEAALALAEALSPSGFVEKKGYIESNDGSRMFTYAFGHLLRFKDPEEMKEEWKEWKWDTLPIIPNNIQLKVIGPREGKQLAVIKQLSSQCDRIINCTDSAQEGEHIFSLIEIYLRFNKPIYRLWTSSLQPSALRQAYKEMKPNAAYNALKNAGMTRALSDYIVGMTGSRALTLAGGTLLNVGRIMTAVLALVYDRHMERSSFKKLKYNPIIAKFSQANNQYQGHWVGERITLPNQALSIANQVKGKPGVITSVKEENKQTPPPLLMDLTDVSRIANQRFHYTGTQTLEKLQSLYLKKAISYPRSGSRYITPAEITLMHKAFDVLQTKFPHLAARGNKAIVHEENNRLVNVEKIEDHHAILPEPVIAENLSIDEQNIYSIIVERFFMQFQPPMQYVQKDIVTEVEGHKFQSSYKQIINPGWQNLVTTVDDEAEEKEDITFTGLPNVQKGSTKCIDTIVEEKETSPPPAYNDGSLMSMMSNISNRISDPELKEKLKDCGIGTSATRANTIKKLLDYEYLVYVNKKSLTITKKGIILIETLRKTNIQLLTSPEMTAIWEKELEAIRNGKSNKPFMDNIVKLAHMIVSESKKITLDPNDFKETFGNCPKCNKPITVNQKSYYCTGYKEGCEFFIWKEQYHKKITPKMLEQLLSKGKTGKLSFTSKKSTKNKEKAYLVLPPKPNNGKLLLEFVAE